MRFSLEAPSLFVEHQVVLLRRSAG